MSKVVRPHAQELSEEESEALVKRAFELERLIKLRVRKAHEAWWDLAESLHEFHGMWGWRLLGYERLEEFLAQPEVGIARRSFFRAVQMWGDLVVTKKLPPSDLKQLEPAKVREVTPAIVAGEVKPKQALADAESLSLRDVVKKYRHDHIVVHGQQPDNSTPLNAADEPKLAQCPLCSSWVREDVLPPQVPADDG